MATVEYWIQIENHAWDVSPSGRDRMDGKALAVAPTSKTLTSPETGVVKVRSMWKPLAEDALILRRYTANWVKPDDRKVNPWDLNELDPTDNGTMGTIPGPVIECNVGDRVIVHFRNRDERADKDVRARTHSLHPHGFVFAPTSDGAFPLSPADPGQAVGPEAPVWASLPAAIAVGNFKKGDRVPPPILGSGNPGGTYTYTWETFGWPTTAGTWLYHDHSVCDMDSVNHGAIGIIVIHNNDPAKHAPIDPDDVAITNADLPAGSPIGSPIRFRCFPFPTPIPRLPADLEFMPLQMAGAMTMADTAVATSKRAPKAEESPAFDRMVARGDLLLELDPKLEMFIRHCFRTFRDPPDRAQYPLLFHELVGAGMCINGRKYVGNTPTLVSGKNTKMRFCIVGMGDNFHTFHLHGHRWVIPGPDGNNPGAIQNSPQIKAVSQFEDTRAFGPANSFVFTIDQSAGFMRADPFTPGSPLGEWHLHCHVLGHMSDGMMGSLLIVQGGQLFFGLPEGAECPPGGGVPPGAHVIPMTAVPLNVNPTGFAFGTPSNPPIKAGDTVVWQDSSMAPHQIGWTSAGSPPNTAVIPAMGTSPPVVMPNPGTFNYICLIHGPQMNGSITVVP
jgi:FtsP/CotA-like multicopper oxidase with cupredoxin domain/plastocyanin